MADQNHEGRPNPGRESDEALIAALAAGLTYAQSGALVGMSERTVARRMSEPAFAREVSFRRDAVMAEIVGSLTALRSAAFEAISACLAYAEPPVRLRAAHLVLSLFVQFRHAGELEQRLRAAEDDDRDGPAVK